MFYYFGAKHQAAHRYQPPKHDTIIEPFAGAAGYACYWLSKKAAKRAILFDSDERVVETWQRILASTPQDIMSWPTPTEGEMSDDLCIIGGSGGGVLGTLEPNSITARNVEKFPRVRSRIAQLRASIGDKISVTHGDYRDAPDIEATWFIDPPYQNQGRWYRDNSAGIDYSQLAQWVRTRLGQAVVCEASPADWLPFRSLYSLNSLAGTDGTELVWESDPEPTLFDENDKITVKEKR